MGAIGVAGQLVIQHRLTEQLSNAEAINIAGRQRMLSQRMTKSALLALLPLVDAERGRQELAEDLEAWEAAHERLARGDLARSQISVVTPETRAMMANVESAKRELASALSDLLERGQESDVQIQRLGRAERRYLALMDELVFAYSSIAEARIAETQHIEAGLLALLITILLLEALLVFRPMHGALARAIRRLRESRDRLQQSEARYTRVLAGARDGFFDWNVQTGELEISPRFRELWGLSPDAPVDWDALGERLAASDQARLALWLGTNGAGELDLEVRVQRDDGWGWVHVRGAPSHEGFVSGRLSNIDNQRRLLAERDRLLAVRDAQLQDADVALERSAAMTAVATLAGGLAHDFNNYLQVIQLQAEHLEHRSDGASESVTAIRTAATEASALAGQLLTLARGDVGSTLESVQVTAVVSKMRSLLSRMVPESVEVVLEGEAELPHIDGNRGQLRQLLVNLVMNASDAMPEGGQIRVQTQSKQLAGSAGIELTVLDEGHGMDADTVRRAFEPFFTTKPPGNGTGLGLAMVNRIVERHRGRVSIESAEGSGTAVRMWFPARVPDAQDNVAEAKVEPMILLLVDDDPGILRALRRQLRKAGHQVHVAATGAEAVELAHGLPNLDLLITDVMLPDLLGPEVADQVRRQCGTDLPVLFISGYAPEHVHLSGPGTRLLVKPFASAALEREIARHAPRPRAAAQ